MSSFSEIIQFASSASYSKSDFLFRAESRAEISARLLSWAQLCQVNGLSKEMSFLIASIVGEIANNSFDHNLGKWKDEVGCLIGFDFLSDRLRFAVVDRGQGIVNSLRAVRPEILVPSEYLVMAFEQVVSGRSPEQRGNGLKYVRKNFLKENGIEMICRSSSFTYSLGDQKLLATEIQKLLEFEGTLIAIDWPKEGRKV
jgi:sensor histidine kinase regulating citrate/malate metabolism